MFKKNDNIYRKAVELYCGKHILNLLNTKNEKQFELYMDKKELTISFYNVVSLPISNMEPQFLIVILNAYFDAVFYAVDNNDGIVLNIHGDEIIAIFSDDSKQHEIKAIKAYFEAEKRFMKAIEEQGLKGYKIFGAGINTGDVLLGNVGSGNRIFYSIMGDHVNLSNRLAFSNQIFKTNIIISDFTYQRVCQSITCRELDAIRVKGLKEPLTIYEVISIKDS